MLKPNLKIFQGRFKDLGTPDQIVEVWKEYDVVYLTPLLDPGVDTLSPTE